MATFFTTSAATCCSLASSASPSMGGGGGGGAGLSIVRLPLPTTARSAVVSVRASSGEKSSLSEVERGSDSNSNNRRRALLFGAAALLFGATTSLLASPGSHSALADAPIDGKKKKNKCPTICVQTPTASCCFGYGK